MKIVIFTLVPVIILAIINKSGILPDTIYYILVMIVAAIGGYFFWMRFGSIITRDNMNYQEYDWYFDPSTAPTGSSSSTDPWASLGSLGTCIGQDCCSAGQLYDETLDQCVGDSTTPPSSTDTYATSSPQTSSTKTKTTTESFVTEAMVERMLTKTENGKHKSDVVYNGNNSIQPNKSDSFIYKN
jgi:hypothetical protein